VSLMSLDKNKNIGTELLNFSELFSVLIVLSILDIGTTIISQKMGYTELIDFSQHLSMLFGNMGFVYVKIIVLAIMFFFLFGFYVLFGNVYKNFHELMAIGLGFVVFSNLCLIFMDFSPFEYLSTYIGGIL
jgi:hypothetical protein